MPKLAKWEKDNRVEMKKYEERRGQKNWPGYSVFSVAKPEYRDGMGNRDYRERLHDAGIPSEPWSTIYAYHTGIRIPALKKYLRRVERILYGK